MDLSKEMQNKITAKIKELESEKEKFKNNGTLIAVVNRDIELLQKVLCGNIDISEGSKKELKLEMGLILRKIDNSKIEQGILGRRQQEIELIERILEN